MSFKDRFWAFLTPFSYASSLDGLTWDVRSAPSGYYLGSQVNSNWFDGVYVHYAEAWSLNYDRALMYARGKPNEDGSIAWDPLRVAVPAVGGVPAFAYSSAHIATDSEGYPWISYSRKYKGQSGDPNNGYTPWVTKSSTKDGTWTTAPGFPYQLNTTVVIGNNGLQTVPLKSSKVYIIYTYPSMGRLWNGSWGPNEQISATSEARGWLLSAVADSEEDIHLVYRPFTEPPYRYIYKRRDHATGVWDADETLTTNVPYDSVLIEGLASIALSVDLSNDDLYCFWLTPDYHVYYKRRTGGAWGDEIDWIDESAYGEPSWESLSCYQQAYDSYVGVLYTTGNMVRFAALGV